MTKENLEYKITCLRQAQINIQHSIAKLVNVNTQLDSEIKELEQLADNI